MFFFCRYATGRTTGVVLDSGDGVTHVVPIYEGFAIPHSIMRVDIAGRDVSRYLRLLLRKEGYNFNTSAEFEVVRTIKEVRALVARSFLYTHTHIYTLANKNLSNLSESLLPLSQPTKGWDFRNWEGSVCSPRWKRFKCRDKGDDWSMIYIFPLFSWHKVIWPHFQIGPARFRAPELLFRPDLIGDESSGIHEVLAYAIQKSDMDLRRTLFSTIVLCGGSTLIKGWWLSFRFKTWESYFFISPLSYWVNLLNSPSFFEVLGKDY